MLVIIQNDNNIMFIVTAHVQKNWTTLTALCSALKENSVIFKPRPYFWHEIRSSTHREQFGESRRPSEDI